MNLKRVSTLSFALIGAWVSVPAHAATLTCQQVQNSPIACDFVIVDKVKGGPARNPLLDDIDPQLSYSTDFLVLGGQSTQIPDQYLGKLFCPEYVSAFRDQLPNKPTPAMLLNSCLKMNLGEVKQSTVWGYFGPTHTVVPPEFSQKSVYDRIDKCILDSSDLANRQYKYDADIFPSWHVTLKPNGTLAFDSVLELVTDAEGSTLSTACHDKWFIDSHHGVYTKISDFSAPTYLGYEKAMASLTKQIEQAITDINLEKSGATMHFQTKSSWYIFYDELYWEMTSTQHPGKDSTALNVDVMVLNWSYVDPVTGFKKSGNEVCHATSICAHSERLYIYPGTLPLKLCGRATAKVGDIGLSGTLPEGSDCWSPNS